MKALKNNEVMKKNRINGLSDLSHEELIKLIGGISDPGDAVYDFGFLIGKIGGWIKNAFTAPDRNQLWMLDVDPRILF